MKKALRKFLTFVGALVITVSLLGWGISFYRYEKSLQLPDKIILKVDFTQPLVEVATASPLSRITGEDSGGTAVTDIVRTLDRARRDGRVAGLIARFGNSEPPLARAQEVAAALNRFRQSGKFAVAYADSFGEMGPADKAYWLAAQMDEIWVQPTGLVGLSGIAVDMPFFRSLLDQYGIKPEVVTRKAYKTAFANATDKGFTPQHREMLDNLLDNLYAQLVDGIARGRKLDGARVRSLIDGGTLTAQAALDAHLIDRLGYMDEAFDATQSRAGLDPKTKDSAKAFRDWGDYAYVTDRRTVKELPKVAPDDKTIAMVRITGLIHSGESIEGIGGGYETSGADTIVAAIDSAREDKDVKAIVLRIDSPGGSAVASETIRHAVTRAVAADKKVIVSMGATAASGGYWVATGAKTIIAEPATLTGSIGVVAGKFAIGDLLKRFNVNAERLQRGQLAGMWSVMTPFSEAERAKVNTLLDQVYGDFKARVMQARGLDAATAEAVAQGRVWTGQEAVDKHLVDELGGLDLAIRRAKEQIGVDTEAPAHLIVLPEAPSRTEQIMNLLKTGLGSMATINRFGVLLDGVKTELAPLGPQGTAQMAPLRL